MSSPEPSPLPGSGSGPLSAPKMAGRQDLIQSSEGISLVIDTLKQRVAANRCNYVKKRMEENKLKLDNTCNQLLKFSKERRNNTGGETSTDLLMKRMNDAFTQNGSDNGEPDSNSSEEDSHSSSAILLGSSIPVKNAVRPIKLNEVKRLPPYTTWIFLDRNQRMAEDQSVVGRRRIYYDQNGGEALICSDSEEEKIEEEEEKKEFKEPEDYILRMTIKEAGSSDAVLDKLAQCFSRKPCEIKERYEVLAKGENPVEDLGDPLCDKDLDAALDSFDNLFCRRCFVFDCRLHGCSQDLVFPVEKQLPWNSPDEENSPCGPYCYKVVVQSESNRMSSPMSVDSEEKQPSSDGSGARSLKKKPVGPSRERRARSCQSESVSSSARNISGSSGSETKLMLNNGSGTQSSSPTKLKRACKWETHKRNSKQVTERVLVCTSKRQKKTETSVSDPGFAGNFGSVDMKLRYNFRKGSQVSTPLEKPKAGRGRPRKIPLTVDNQRTVQLEGGASTTNEVIMGKTVCSNGKLGTEESVSERISKLEISDSKPWKTIEKSLYDKGLEIFGRNSCLVARNLMNGMKTCSEVFQYMNCSENRLPFPAGDGTNSMLAGYSNFDSNETTGNEARRRSRFLRRRGRVRRLKYTWKSAGYPSFRKRISDKKDQPCRQFNPCGCESACGKECPCHVNGTCCEKYCGCPKTCKNRFRGCHCAKSQCRSRQCPCFAADRECDPDVCRNCWISCGDGSLGVPSQRGDNYECRNMKLLLKQQQRVLLGPSDVSGWGAFLKNSVGKHEYLGEYTGELISHREADKRGKIYDRENSSFLFNLNDQFVLDAFRRGDKLKFANHSPDPNCYAKVMMVAGDHRVGIFAKERINAGEELFYDYRYEADRAPAWARKPEAPGSKKEETGPSTGRAKKLA